MEEQLKKRELFWKDVRKRVTNYHNIKKDIKKGKDRAEIRRDADATLRYLNMKWLVDGQIPEQTFDTLQIWSPFSSPRTLRIVGQAASHPFIRRLQFIKQLGTTYLNQRRDACHTRWSHTIGVVECAGQFLDAFDNNHCPLENAEDETALAIGALIHDAMQGPWGHSLEIAGSLFVVEENITRTVRLDKLLLRAEIDDPNSELRDAIKPCFNGLDETLVLEKLGFIIDKDICRRKQPDSYYLAQTLDFLIDADRLDYLPRDAIHTYTSATMLDQWQKVIQGVTVARLKDPQDTKLREPLKRLVFRSEHEPIIQSILTFRRDMYSMIYEHPHKIIIDDMLCHALFYVLRFYQIIPSYESDPNERKSAMEVTKQVLRLVDEDLMQFIIQSANTDHPSMIRALELILDIYRDRPYREITPRYTISRDDMKRVEANLKGGLEAIDVAVERYAVDNYDIDSNMSAVEAAYYLKPEEYCEVVADALEDLEKIKRWGQYEDLLLLDFRLLRGRYTVKYELEHIFWEKLLTLPKFQTVLQNYVDARYGTISEEMKRKVTTEPLIHISCAGYTRYTVREMLDHATEHSKGERLAFYDPSITCSADCAGGHTAKKDSCMYYFCDPDPATAEGFKAWGLILSCQPELASDPEAVDIIRREWQSFAFRERPWVGKMQVTRE